MDETCFVNRDLKRMKFTISFYVFFVDLRNIPADCTLAFDTRYISELEPRRGFALLGGLIRGIDVHVGVGLLDHGYGCVFWL